MKRRAKSENPQVDFERIRTGDQKDDTEFS